MPAGSKPANAFISPEPGQLPFGIGTGVALPKAFAGFQIYLSGYMRKKLCAAYAAPAGRVSFSTGLHGLFCLSYGPTLQHRVNPAF